VVNREEDSHQRFLPLVVLDLTKRVKVDKNNIVAFVVVLREKFFLEHQIIYYEGMVDVFAIKQKKVRSEDSFTLEEVTGGFEIFPNTTEEEAFDEISLLFLRSKVAEALHDTLQAAGKKTGRCTTVPVPISRSDFRLLREKLAAPIPKFVDAKSRVKRYNIELGGTAVMQDVLNSTASISVHSVDVFEGLFGYISTLKYLCGKKVDTNISMENYGANKIVMNGRVFHHMEFSYDRSNQQGTFCFNIQDQTFEDMVKYLDDRRTWFLNDYIKAKANSQSLLPSNTSSSKQCIVYGAIRVGEKRSYATSSQHREDPSIKKIDVKELENAIVAKSGKECVRWHEHLVWMVKQLGLPTAAYPNIYDGIIYISGTTTLSLDGMIQSLGLASNNSSKKEKIHYLASTIQSWYEEQI
jgi:hypothetical protein